MASTRPLLAGGGVKAGNAACVPFQTQGADVHIYRSLCRSSTAKKTQTALPVSPLPLFLASPLPALKQETKSPIPSEQRTHAPCCTPLLSTCKADYQSLGQGSFFPAQERRRSLLEEKAAWRYIFHPDGKNKNRASVWQEWHTFPPYLMYLYN